MSRSSISEIDLDRSAVHTASCGLSGVSAAIDPSWVVTSLPKPSKRRILRVPFLQVFQPY